MGELSGQRPKAGPSCPAAPCHPPQELNEQKGELLAKVQTLKKELVDWRGKLDNQVKSYRTVGPLG